MAKSYGLGRGLNSLIPQKNSPSAKKTTKSTQAVIDPQPSSVPNTMRHMTGEGTMTVSVSSIKANELQPRLYFNKEKLEELSESIKVHGILQPLVVIEQGKGFELIAGERRLRAAKKAGLKEVPVVIKEKPDNQKKLELSLIENIQRHDLNVIEEAKAYKKLMDDYSLTQNQVAKRTGKSRSVVANRLRILDLPVEAQKALTEGTITEGHAKAILAVDTPEKRLALFTEVKKGKLTVRQAEEKTKDIAVKPHTRKRKKDPKIAALEDELAEQLGTIVTVKKAGNGGKIIIDYFSDEELEAILGKLG